MIHCCLFCLVWLFFFAGLGLQVSAAGRPDADLSDRFAAAENVPEPESLYFFLDPPVTTASRFRQAGSDAPAHVMVISGRTIRERGYRSLIEVLKDLPGFDVQERIGGQAGGAYVIQRGLFGNNKIQVFRDGIQLNPANGTHLIYGQQLSVDGLDRIEVLYGPASAMYGPDAFAGVINMVSKEVQGGRQVEGRVSAGSNDTFEGYLLTGARRDDLFLQVYGHGVRTSGFDMAERYSDRCYTPVGGSCTSYYRTDRGFEAPAQSFDLMARAGAGPLTFEALYYHDRQPNNIQTPWNTGRTQDADDAVRWNSWDLRAKHEFDPSPSVRVTTTLDYQYYEIAPDSRYGRETFDNYIYERSKSFKAEQQVDWDYHLGKVVAGFSAKRVSTMPYLNSRTPFDEGDSFDDFPVTSVILSDGSRLEVAPIEEQDYWYYGGFLQVSHRLTTDLTLTVGGRYDWETFNHDETFNPRLGLVYRLGRAESVKLIYGRAYIFPSPYFKYKTWIDEQGDYAHLSPELFGKELDPEELESVELSYERHTEGLDINLSLFWSQARNMIQEAGSRLYGNTFILQDGSMVTDAIIELPENLGTQTSVGTELSLTYRPRPWLALDLAYSFINARIEMNGHGYDAPKVSNHKIAGGVSGTLGRRLSCSLRFRWYSGIHTQPTNSVYQGDTMKGAFILDGNVRWLDLFPGVDLEFRARNILDHRYFTAGNGNEDSLAGTSLPEIPQEPASYFVSLSWRY